MSDRDTCATKLSSLRKDDVIVVGKTRWRVWKNVGVTNLVEKEGSKGRKLYTLEATNLAPCCISVREVWPGSGEVKVDKPAVAKGCSRNGATLWSGYRQRQR